MTDTSELNLTEEGVVLHGGTIPWRGRRFRHPRSGPATRRAAARPGGMRTRIGGVWSAAVVFAVVLLLLLIFILENRREVDIAYFGAHAHMPLGVALLLAAVLGALLVAIPAATRIMQQRMSARSPSRATGKSAERTQTATPETPSKAAGQLDGDQRHAGRT